MGLYIEKMEMPAACFACKLLSETYWECRVHGDANHSADHRPTDCPLTEVPEPHGRLGDLDALINDHPRTWTTYDLQRIADTPTIIPPSEEVYDKYTDTAGNLHWTGTQSGKHIIPA